MSPELARLLELSGGINVTIAAATKKNGSIDRKKADRMLDPHGYFKSKWPTKLREYLAKVEEDSRCRVRLRSDRPATVSLATGCHRSTTRRAALSSRISKRDRPRIVKPT